MQAGYSFGIRLKGFLNRLREHRLCRVEFMHVGFPRWMLISNKTSGRSISRILLCELRKFTPRGFHPCHLTPAIIYLCSLPETKRSGPLHRLCLTLLPTGVAWPPTLLPAPVVSYTAISL